MFKISISIISVLILLLSIYSSTIVSIDYFGDNNSKLPEPRHEMRMFHEPSPEIRKNEIELEKQYRQNDVSREISKIDSILKNLENKNYESVKTDLEQERLRIQDDLDLDLKRMDLDMLRMNP
tara:strand:+ start:171 stop:539 length:369 start_codon:yes stop_codon:yes gene_type:complete